MEYPHTSTIHIFYGPYQRPRTLELKKTWDGGRKKKEEGRCSLIPRFLDSRQKKKKLLKGDQFVRV